MLSTYFVSGLAIHILAKLGTDAIAASIWAVITHRLIVAFSTIPDLRAWACATALLLIYTLISLPIGFQLGFVQVEVFKESPSLVASIIAGSFLMPGISEELFFRVLLLPHPSENVSLVRLLWWGGISLFLFLIYHPLNVFALGHDTTFREPVFLLLAALLGVVCTISYWQSGSIWPPVVIHWLIVVVWILLLGGYKKLHN